MISKEEFIHNYKTKTYPMFSILRGEGYIYKNTVLDFEQWVKVRATTTRKKKVKVKETTNNGDNKGDNKGIQNGYKKKSKKGNTEEIEKKIKMKTVYFEVAKDSWKRLKPQKETKRPIRKSMSGILAKAKKKQKQEKEEKSKKYQKKRKEEEMERAEEEERNKEKRISGQHQRNLDRQFGEKKKRGMGCGPKCYIF